MQLEQYEYPQKMQLAEMYADRGYDDVLVLSADTASDVMTAKRRELLDTIRTQDVASIRDLARRVDRKPNAVFRDLQVLIEHDIVGLRDDDNRKIPYLIHDLVVVEPLIAREPADESA